MTTGLRVASFVPAATEWMYYLGLDDQLVGVTFECDVPARAKREHPVLVKSPDALDFDELTAGEIHTAVTGANEHGQVLFDLDEAALAAARPDVILAQSLCEVCAASDPHLEAAARVVGENTLTVGLNATSLHDAWEDGRAIAEAAARPDVEDRVDLLEERVARVAHAVRHEARPRVALLEWTNPPMHSGHWLPDVVHAAGGDEVLGRAGEKSGITTWEDVEAARPDVIFVAPCGFDTKRALAEARGVARRFPTTRVIALDARHYLTRSGPSLATSVELLAHLLHPRAVPDDPAPQAWAVAQAQGEGDTADEAADEKNVRAR